MVVLNFCVFLYNQGERKAATKQFNNFEQRMQKLGKDGVNNIDQEVWSGDLSYFRLYMIFINIYHRFNQHWHLMARSLLRIESVLWDLYAGTVNYPVDAYNTLQACFNLCMKSGAQICISILLTRCQNINVMYKYECLNNFSLLKTWKFEFELYERSNWKA